MIAKFDGGCSKASGRSWEKTFRRAMTLSPSHKGKVTLWRDLAKTCRPFLNFLGGNLDFRKVRSGCYGTGEVGSAGSRNDRKRKPRSRSRRGAFNAQVRN